MHEEFEELEWEGMRLTIQPGPQAVFLRHGDDQPYLRPGVFTRHHLVDGWDGTEVIEREAARVGNSSFDARMRTMNLIDWFTRPRVDALDGLPVPTYVQPALATALETTSELARRHRDLEAVRLRADGLTASEIAARLGTHVKNVQPSRIQRRLPSWPNADAVVEAVRRAPVYRRTKSVNAKLIVYDAVRWFSERGEPMRYAVWWATICALGLGHGMPGARRAGLTDVVVRELEGRVKPDAYRAAAQAIGSARASYPRGSTFTGVEPLALNTVAKIAAAASEHHDRRRRSDAANAEADTRATLRREDLRTDAPNRVTVEEWAAEDAFQRLASNFETIERFNRPPKRT